MRWSCSARILAGRVEQHFQEIIKLVHGCKDHGEATLEPHQNQILLTELTLGYAPEVRPFFRLPYSLYFGPDEWCDIQSSPPPLEMPEEILCAGESHDYSPAVGLISLLID